METQICRLKDAIEKVNSECEMLRNKDSLSQDLSRKLQGQLRQLREDFAEAQQKETEANSKKNELEKQLELSEAETVLVNLLLTKQSLFILISMFPIIRPKMT